MSNRWNQLWPAREAGSCNLVGGGKGLSLYFLLGLTQVCAVLAFDADAALSFLLFPLVLGIAVLAGLAFKSAGAIASFLVLFLVGGFLYLQGSGIYQNMSDFQGALLFSATSILGGVFSFLSGIVVAYSQRTAEMAIHRQNLLYEVFDSLPIGIWVRARDGRSLFVNERWAGFSQMSVEQILNSGQTEAPVKLGDEWDSHVAKVLESDKSSVRYDSIELSDSKGGKSTMTLLTFRMYIDQEKDYGTLSLLLDESALRIYEEKVRQGEQNLELALQNAGMGFWDEDLRTGKALCDDNWLDLIDVERAANQSALDIWNERLHPDDRARVSRLYSDFYQSFEDALRVEYRIRKGEKKYIWVQDNVRIADRDDYGKPLRIVGTMQDISEQKQIEKELQEAKERAESANETKSQFIATISHEIRTPLNAIIGLSSCLTEGELEGESLDLAQTIYSSGKRLLVLVNDILDFSKIEAGRLNLEVQEFPLPMCFQDSVKLFHGHAVEKNVELKLYLSGQLPEFAFGDMERLRQIVQNLLSNALKFTDAGKVDVSVRPVTLEQVDDSRRPNPLELIGYLDHPDHNYLEVRVQDTGIGIPKDRQHVLFEAFSQVDASTTRKYGGTGLGLVICKRLVDAMGGCIWVESEEGKGSTFCFVVRTYFILENAELAGVMQTPFDLADRIAEKHPCDILIIGSEGGTQALMSACRSLGYAPHSIEDYDLEQPAFRRRRYNIMFIWMGDELKALELSRKISTSGNMLRPDSIVGWAGPEQSISEDRCRLSGIHKVVQEEFSPKTLRKVILGLLGARD